jgi:hypothetical protein
MATGFSTRISPYRYKGVKRNKGGVAQTGLIPNQGNYERKIKNEK